MEDYKTMYDLIIIGAGPAGLSAAIYMSRAKYRVLVIEKEKFGGQITITEEIVNYPGVKKTTGKELTENMRHQAEYFGAEFMMAEVLNMELEGDIKKLFTTQGEFQSLAVVLAVGANPRKLGFKGEKEFQGRGVAYCATCDGEFFTDMDVFVIGGGFAAVEEGIFLTKYANHVRLIVREEDFSCAKNVSEKLKGIDKIDVLFHTEITEVSGGASLEYAKFVNNKTGAVTEHRADERGFGVFVFAGYVPNTKWLPKCIELNEQGYIKTDRNQETNVPGVYAAGDVCIKNLRQVVTAVSDGAVAATVAEKHVSLIHEKLGIPEFEVKQMASSGFDEQEINISKDNDSGFLTSSMKHQLSDVFSKFESNILLKAWLDDSNLSGEIRGFLEELCDLSGKIKWENGSGDAPDIIPSIEICREDGKSSGIHFHGVPGGHEINSFVIAMYNVAGPGKAVIQDVLDQINKIDTDVNIKILVSLSCTMCPETVMSAQHIASLRDNVTAEMIDLSHYPDLKEKYNVMSVPCMVINDSNISFGKKGIQEVLSEIEKAR